MMENEEKEEPGPLESNPKPLEKTPSKYFDEIEQLYPNLKIEDATEEMIGKTSLFTMVLPAQKKKE